MMDGIKREEPIAIIGMGCRFPGDVNNTKEFWEMLMNNKDAITEIPEDRWSINSFYDKNNRKNGKSNSKKGAFLKSKIDEFDANFFNISPREAAMIDPQQRLLMEVCYEALEDGGIPVSTIAGSNTGVFIGGFTLDWKILQFKDSNRQLIDSHSATGSMMTLLSNRLSYIFDLKGPSMSIDTACSSSLVSVHLACQNIWDNHCSMAIAGGVNLMFMPEYFIAESKAGMLSPDGYSKTYDKSANGYVRGEGAGIVILKPLSLALQNNDKIHGVITATGCNQDGHTKGITIPSGESQSSLMREVYHRAGILPSEIQYVEAHGTGTPVGDPIEANAVGSVLSCGRKENDFCYISSVKTYIGHLEAAAGISGLIKTVLCMKNGMIPKHLHLKNPNPAIDFESMLLKVPTKNTPWPNHTGAKRAAVNSFGFGGTNAHVLLEEYPTRGKDISLNQEKSGDFIVPISAKSEKSLTGLLEKIADMDLEGVSINDIGWSFGVRRTHHEKRLAVVAQDKKELQDKLHDICEGKVGEGIIKGNLVNKSPKLVMVFTGMGPQWWAMGHQMYKSNAVFKETLERVDKEFSKLAGWSLLEMMMADEQDSQIEETKLAQPANFALQIALAEVWKSYGVSPDAIVGHSAGEVAAAYIAGALTFEDAVKVIYIRSTLQQLTTGKGKMLAADISFDEVSTMLGEYKGLVSIAAINSPSSVTLSGDEKSLDELSEKMKKRSIFNKYLRVKVPYHSHYLESMKAEFFEQLNDISPNKNTIALYSTVSGGKIDGKCQDTEYWWKNARDPVFFMDACSSLINDGYTLFLEVGPHPVLFSSIQDCLLNTGNQGKVAYSLRRNMDENKTMLSSLGELYTFGYDVCWDSLYPSGNIIENMPTYPWDKERHWQESSVSQSKRTQRNAHPLLGCKIDSPDPQWENELDIGNAEFLEDHKIQSTVTFPGAGYIEMSLAAIKNLYGSCKSVYGENISFKKAMFLTEDQTVNTRLTYNKNDCTFKIYSKPITPNQDTEWTLNAQGNVSPSNSMIEKYYSISSYQSRCNKEISKIECYERFKNLGLVYGELFQGITTVWQGNDEALAKIDLKVQTEEMNKYQIHPTVLDLCFQVLASALPFTDGNDSQRVYMPTEVAEARILGDPAKSFWIYAQITKKDEKSLLGDIVLMDRDGKVILEIKKCKAISISNEAQSYSKKQDFFELIWRKKGLFDESDNVEKTQKGIWIVFADEKGLADKFAYSLNQQAYKTIVIKADKSYLFSETKATINPDNPQHFQQLISDIHQLNDGNIAGIVHFWSIDIASTENLDVVALKEAEVLGTQSALYLIQELSKIQWGNYPKIYFVTNKSQQVLIPCEETNIGQATLWGLGRVIGHQEHRDFYGGLIDIDVLDGSACELIHKEIFSQSKEDMVAFRSGERYVARMVESKDLDKPFPVSFRADASYMITGGFGALGLLTAKWMIENGARRLVLISRSEVPSREHWESENDEDVLSRIEAIRELEKMGATIHAASIDVTDENDLNDYIKHFYSQGYPAFKGVFHLAGVAKPQRILEMNKDNFDRVLRPKTMGAWNLHKCFDNADLDYFVLFSSIASLVVLGGQGNYAAGNAFMDALAGYRKARGKSGISINWGPWGEVGMATQLDLLSYFIKKGFYPMSPEQGIDALEHIISQNQFQVAVLGADWQVVGNMSYPMGKYPNMILELMENSNGEQKESNIATDFQNEKYLSVLMKQEDELERNNLLKEYLKNIISLVLRLNRDSIDESVSLSSWGLDSMMAIELKNQIQNGLEVSIEVVELLKGPTMLELSEIISKRLNEKLSFTGDIPPELLEKIQELSVEEAQKMLESLL